MFYQVVSLLLELSFFSLALAAPTYSTTGHGNVYKFGTGGGIVGFIVLVLDIIIFMEIFKSDRSPLSKLLWVLGVFFFPVIGMIVYWLFSDREKHNSGSYETLP